MRYGPPKFAYRPAQDLGRGCHTSVVIFTAHQFRENADLTLLKPNNSKKSPINPPDFWQQASGHKGLLEYGLKFGKNCLPLAKTPIQKRQLGKKYFFKNIFLTSKAFFFELFLLVSSVNLLAVYWKKRKKSENFFLHTENGGVRRSGYTYRGGYTYRAGCMYLCAMCRVVLL